MKWPWQPVVDVVDNLINLGDQYIVDQDKLIEFKFKAYELKTNAVTTLLGVKTNPFIDGLVKLMYAFQIFWRPFVGGLMTMFGAYCHYKGIEMDVALHAIFDGAFPAWGVSRHIEKQKKIEKRPSWEWEDDLGDFE